MVHSSLLPRRTFVVEDKFGGGLDQICWGVINFESVGIIVMISSFT